MRQINTKKCSMKLHFYSHIIIEMTFPEPLHFVKRNTGLAGNTKNENAKSNMFLFMLFFNGGCQSFG